MNVPEVSEELVSSAVLVQAPLHADEGLILARHWTLTSWHGKPVAHRYRAKQ